MFSQPFATQIIPSGCLSQSGTVLPVREPRMPGSVRPSGDGQITQRLTRGARHKLPVVPGRKLLLMASALAAACSPGAANRQNDVVEQAFSPASLPAFFDCLRESGRT